MPQRFLRPGITNSERWNSVSWEAQSFFIRILTLVDDFGRFDGRIAILHGQCFALRDDVKPQRIAVMRTELEKAKLIQVYSVDGKEFLQVTQWQERIRSNASKYPPPADIPQDSAADCSGPQDSAASIEHRHTPSPSNIEHTPPELEAVMKKWNDLPSPFPKIRTLTADRRASLRARLKGEWPWEEALDQVPKSGFLRGEGKEKWVADFDWFIRPDSAIKILEGKYGFNGNGHITDPSRPIAPAEPTEESKRLAEEFAKRANRE